jgi:hypothetical protein
VGTGYLTRRFGLTVDNLLEVDVVLADGSFVKASEHENPDFFWAIRGGGGNFGVVTSFLFQAHPVETVYAGPIFWEAKHAAAVMRAYRDFLPSAPEELGIFVGLKTVPPVDPFPSEYQGKHACAIIGAYNGSAAEGQRAIAPLLDAVPPPIFDWMQEMPFPAMQSLFDPFFPKGLQWYWKGDFVRSLPDEAIDTHIAQAAEAPSALSLMHLYPIDGAVHRVPERRHRLERTGCLLLDGDRGGRLRTRDVGRAQALGPRLLGGRAPVQPLRRVRQLHDGRRGREPPARELRGELRASRAREERSTIRRTSSGSTRTSSRRTEAGRIQRETAGDRSGPPADPSLLTRRRQEISMFIAIVHDIHDPARFQARAEQVFPLPDALRVHHFLPASDLSEAVCLYEAPTIDAVRDYLDPALGDSSTQHYFPVAEQQAMGLPERVLT